jgi:hypothetical protein
MSTPDEPGYVTPRETDALHEAVQEHIRGCKTCSEASQRGTPRAFGQAARMCSRYFEIVAAYAEGLAL